MRDSMVGVFRPLVLFMATWMGCDLVVAYGQDNDPQDRARVYLVQR